ncbi:glycosyltransferase involved in cell wall biosynthesis [Paraburkholderia sp. EB58]|uniref:glycosyltransferase family 4 protein n=1 Tax=Paraburkholderia sp. EB58 TaxID=3035125 RepID=UPI003D22F070
MDKNAGAPGATARIAEAMTRRGHITQVFSFSDSSGWSRQRLEGIRFPWQVFVHVARHPEFDVLDLSSGDGWIIALLKKLGWRSHQIVVTRSHGLEHVMHDKLLDGCRNGTQKKSWKYPIYNGGFRLWECKTSFQMADASLLLNQYDMSYAISKLRVKRERAHLIQNGIDSIFLETAIENAKIAEMEISVRRNIAFIGTYIHRKGIRALKPAAIRILERYPDVNLGFFGIGPRLDDVLSDYPTHLHQRLQIAQTFENSELPSLLKNYSILAFPSISEGFSVVGLEAMACGLVPVSSKIPGPTEYIVHDHNGLVVQPEDSEDLHDAICRLLEDPHLWNRLRRNAIATAINFSWDRIAAAQECIYETVMQRKRGSKFGHKAQ